jgi:hypothetical protein
MQMLHPWRGSIQQYEQEISDPDRYRPDQCPLCHARDPLRAHGFYCRTLVDVQYDGSVRVRRFLCLLCRRTVSLLPEFVLPYFRFTIQVISLFLLSRLLYRRTLREAAGAAFQPNMPYQRGQFWIRRFHQQATGFVRRLGQPDYRHPGKRFFDPGITDARGNRLDPRPSFPLD